MDTTSKDASTSDIVPEGGSRAERKQAKRLALLALWLVVLQAIPISLGIVLKIKVLLVAAVLFLHWGIPLIAALVIEKRGVSSLGLVLQKEQIRRYVFFALVGFVVAYIVHNCKWLLLVHVAPESAQELASRGNVFVSLFIQLAMVVLPEELLYRGYLQTRFCEWLGSARGLLLSSILFGFVHVFSRVMSQGATYALPAFIVGTASFFSGLVFGFQYLKTRSIAPSAVAHIALNLTPILLVIER